MWALESLVEIIPRGLSASETVKRYTTPGALPLLRIPFDRIRQGVGDLVYSVNFDAVEVYNGHTMISYKNPRDILRNLRVPAVGGSDAHLLSEIALS